jgi:predicted nucleic acid-binding Zn ribbon protein
MERLKLRKRIRPFLKHCQQCQEPFVAQREHGKYCSEKCKRDAYVLRKAEKLQTKKSSAGIIHRILNFFRS